MALTLHAAHARNSMSGIFTSASVAIATSPMVHARRHLLIGRGLHRSSVTRRKSTGNPRKSQTEISKDLSPKEDSNLLNAPRTRGRDDDALARYPNLQSPGGFLRGLDYAGTLTFALTGSVTAAQSGLDVFGCSMVGMVTAVGGGTFRDAVLLSKRPFWTEETEYIWMTVVTGFLTFFAWPFVLEWQRERRRQHENHSPNENSTPIKDGGGSGPYYDKVDAALNSFDAVGLAAFAIIGAQNGIRAGMPMVVSAICGMATSTFGGLTRDVLCGRPVRIVHSNAEVYAQPALAGAVTYLFVRKLNVSPGARVLSALVVCMGSRFLAVKHDLKLHTWDTKNDGLGIAVRKSVRR